LYTKKRKSFCELLELIFRYLPSPEQEAEQVAAGNTRHVTFSYLKYFLPLFPETYAEYQEALEAGTVSAPQLLDKVTELETKIAQQQDRIAELEQQLNDKCVALSQCLEKQVTKQEVAVDEPVAKATEEPAVEQEVKCLPDELLKRAERASTGKRFSMGEKQQQIADYKTIYDLGLVESLLSENNKQAPDINKILGHEGVDAAAFQARRFLIKLHQDYQYIDRQVVNEPVATRKRLNKNIKQPDIANTIIQQKAAKSESVAEVSDLPWVEEVKAVDAIPTLTDAEVALITRLGQATKLDLTDSNTRIDLGKAHKMLLDSGLLDVPSILEQTSKQGEARAYANAWEDIKEICHKHFALTVNP
jgi:hypothetical protein